ncbi:MAG: hypothetical protein V8R46_10700 [Eubacterium ramulus]
MKQYAMVVEVDRCIGCKGGCQVACKTENEVALAVPEAHYIIWDRLGSIRTCR